MLDMPTLYAVYETVSVSFYVPVQGQQEAN